MDYKHSRELLLAREGAPTAMRRIELSELTDQWLTEIATNAGVHKINAALIAVGGYGREELAPGSDLDLVLLVDANTASAVIQKVADALWYPIWDAGVMLDHSVRTVAQARTAASDDLKVTLGLLDARTITGNSDLTTQLLSQVLSDWRASGTKRLAELRAYVDERSERSGDLAHLLEPDLKDSFGGIRDITILRAIAASWVTDVDHGAIDDARDFLLNVRDALHCVTGRATDKLVLQEQELVAAKLRLSNSDELLRAVSRAGRTIAYVSDLAWNRVDRTLKSKSRVSVFKRGISHDRRPLADGVVIHDGEVVLAKDANPSTDPVLLLRAAASAAQSGLRLSPHAVERLAKESAALPEIWPRSAREALVSLLGAGRAALPVWEALDQHDLITRMIPEWAVVRSAPQHNPVHLYTVDRHLVETTIHASQMIRRVSRPDLLLVGALLHDIGKGQSGDHSDVGARIVESLAPRLGFNYSDSQILVRLVQHHLLLPDVATKRDQDDPVTIQFVVDRVEDSNFLELLATLSEADARATGPAVISEWRFGLINDLVNKVHAALGGGSILSQPNLGSRLDDFQNDDVVHVRTREDRGAVLATVVAPDCVGLLSVIAGVFTLSKLSVRGASTETIGSRAISEWIVTPQFGQAPDAQRLEQDISAALGGTLNLAERLDKRAAEYRRPAHFIAEPTIQIIEDASHRATVIELRIHDVPGLLYRVTQVFAELGIDIVAAKVATLGSEVVDVFYVVDSLTHAPLTANRSEKVLAEISQRVLVAG